LLSQCNPIFSKQDALGVSVLGRGGFKIHDARIWAVIALGLIAADTLLVAALLVTHNLR